MKDPGLTNTNKSATALNWILGVAVVLVTAYAYQSRSFCYLKEGKTALAIADLNEAVALRLDYPFVYENRAKVYILAGQKDKASADMKTARRLKNTYMDSSHR